MKDVGYVNLISDASSIIYNRYYKLRLLITF